ncbi:MAG TPA: serine/threonine-protein kinase, partial [Polyangiaceae bacterium]|nr:serine/threonine-protein kinase [Polyangiaceae bacterium]
MRLGLGGMASVWVARERGQISKRESLVAVKAMLPELAQQSDFRAMFLEEGQIVRSIDHPNVVRVHEVGEQDGTLFMSMDWVEGDSLLAVIREAKKRRPIPPEMAVKIISDAAAGLHAAHELRGWDGELRNLVHCDVSPHNILVGIDGRAKLVDFGVANATLTSSDDTERIKGKFSYMSPEQARGEKLDRRSDIFSLGIVLYELTTGERLFRGENAAHTLALVTAAEIPDPRSVHSDYPARLADITLRALHRDPSRRYQSAKELRDALDRYLIEERVMVSHAGVAQLVRRVIGARIESLRQSVREALVARDGSLAEGVIPEPPFSTISDASGPKSPSSHSRTPRPQTYETPVPERSKFAPLLAALGGIAAAAASVVWMLHRPEFLESPSSNNAEAPAAQSAPRAAPDAHSTTAASPNDPGVDIGSLPLAATANAPALLPRTFNGRAAARPRGDSKSAKNDKHPEPLGIKLEEAAPVQTPAPAPQPTPTAAVPTTSGAVASFNRGAAMAQLGAAMGRAGACKR